jgi:hypothetical protein
VLDMREAEKGGLSAQMSRARMVPKREAYAE